MAILFRKVKFYIVIPECVIRELEPVGQYYLAHARRKLHNYSFLVDERTLAENEVVDVDEADYEEEEEETPELLKRDPKDWKVCILN